VNLLCATFLLHVHLDFKKTQTVKELTDTLLFVSFVL